MSRIMERVKKLQRRHDGRHENAAGDTVLGFLLDQLRDADGGCCEAGFRDTLSDRDMAEWDGISVFEWTGSVDAYARQFSERQVRLCREYDKWLDIRKPAAMRE
jgi:hypothetical protein